MKRFMGGNEAAAEAAILAGCRHYFGYPITPQNEIGEYMSRRMRQVGGTFLQVESEPAAIYTVMGCSATGRRVMTSSSSPGISLMQEGMSYMAGCQLPMVLINVQRGGPGLGNIGPSQSDYFQATKGGGHGDYKLVVLAPSTVEEFANLVQDAFDIAEKYRNPTMILADGWIGQMMEPVELTERKPIETNKESWALTGCKGRESRIIRSLFLADGVLEKWNEMLQAKYRVAEKNELRVETVNVENADWILVAYGTCARICKEAMGKEKGLKIGVIRPISLWPFPYATMATAAKGRCKGFLTVEMSAGQMVEDVRIGVAGAKPVHFFGRTGGAVPSTEDILAQIEKHSK
jgi:2-oxoglutarate ferredoxin oxidoreductase subunit alpha